MARISKLRNLTLFGKIIAAASRSIKKNAEPQGKWPIGILSRKSVGGMLDQKARRLVTLAGDEQMFTVEYLSASGQKIVGEYSVPMLPSVVDR
jgi:hypothetical protein